jgi:hypothetical protein
MQWHETASADMLDGAFRSLFVDQQQFLFRRASDGHDHSPSFSQLFQQRRRQSWRGGSHEDSVKRCELGQA